MNKWIPDFLTDFTREFRIAFRYCSSPSRVGPACRWFVLGRVVAFRLFSGVLGGLCMPIAQLAEGCSLIFCASLADWFVFFQQPKRCWFSRRYFRAWFNSPGWVKCFPIFRVPLGKGDSLVSTSLMRMLLDTGKVATSPGMVAILVHGIGDSVVI